MKEKNVTIRNERKEDYRTVENLVRESFWNVYRPGCLEHYVLKNLRNDQNFVIDDCNILKKTHTLALGLADKGIMEGNING